jgi:hypothetical protein
VVCWLLPADAAKAPPVTVPLERLSGGRVRVADNGGPFGGAVLGRVWPSPTTVEFPAAQAGG